MKKIYNAPEADLLCFRPVEDLAINFDNLWTSGQTGGPDTAAKYSEGTDIKIQIP